LGAFVLYGSTLSVTKAVEFGAVQYNNDTYIDYSEFDGALVKKTADVYFERALKSQDETQKKDFLKVAGGEYFILTKINPHDLYALDQLARVYDYEGKNSYAKGYFSKALEIDKKHAPTNYYLGNYYYTRNEYKKALTYYNLAYKNGYKEDFEGIMKMATMYEKLGDLLRANQYYKKALLKKQDSKVANKIREIETINYKKTGYYNKRRKTK
jgi:tetratricopeptide (TPR) repeat protein